MLLRIPAILLAAALLFSCADDAVSPPTADKRPVEFTEHDHVRVDNYFWLKERENPEVIAYLDAENAYTDSVLAETAGLQARLIEEMSARIKPDDQSAPYRNGAYFYYVRYEAGQEYPIYARRKGTMQADEEILLDVNKEARGETYYSVRGFSVSPDHKLAAYAVDNRGRRLYTLEFIDLETGEKLADRVENMTANFEWAANSQAVLYARQDPDTLRWDRIYCHEIGSSDDALVYQENDETFSVYVYTSISGQYLFIESQSTLATEVRYVPANNPAATPIVFLPREAKHEYSVEEGADRFYVKSNDNAENFQLYEVGLNDTSKAGWKLILPHRDDVLIENVTVLKNHVVVKSMHNALPLVEVINRESGEVAPIAFDESVYVVWPGDNYEYDSNFFRYDYESLTTPDSVYDVDLNTGTHALVKQKEILGGFDRNNYHAERRFATVRDGTQVPVSIVYRKGLKFDGSNPLLQYAYGSYGSSVSPSFSAERLSLLDRGFIFAIAHIRGGSEMGRQWYYEGRQFKKINTFTDFIDVSKFLIKEGYTSPQHLYARGGSAGGLLMGAVVNMAPELYNGIATRVPFVDVVTTMLDASIPLTTSEWDEWGDPRKPDFYEYMLSYSPYDQIKRQDYPNILVTTALHDSQVQYWEPAKWVAKMRDYKTDDNLLILATDMQAGHSGKTGRFQSLEDTALYQAFFLHLEGMTE